VIGKNISKSADRKIGQFAMISATKNMYSVVTYHVTYDTNVECSKSLIKVSK